MVNRKRTNVKGNTRLTKGCSHFQEGCANSTTNTNRHGPAHIRPGRAAHQFRRTDHRTHGRYAENSCGHPPRWVIVAVRNASGDPLRRSAGGGIQEGLHPQDESVVAGPPGVLRLHPHHPESEALSRPLEAGDRKTRMPGTGRHLPSQREDGPDRPSRVIATAAETCGPHFIISRFSLPHSSFPCSAFHRPSFAMAWIRLPFSPEAVQLRRETHFPCPFP